MQHPSKNTTIIHEIELESSIGLIFLSALVLIILCLLLLNFARGNGTSKNPWYLILMFLGGLVSLLTTATIGSHEEKLIYFIYITVVNVIVGMLVTVIGSHVFFTGVSIDEEPLGFHHPKMSMIIWIVTIPLSLLGIIESVVSWKHDRYKAASYFIGLFQKLIQAGVYHFDLRHKRPRKEKELGASLYLKIISYFNFVMWLDSMLMVHKGSPFLDKTFGKGFSIVAFALSALLIDYHLLCCLIFAEHSIEVDNPSRVVEFEDDAIETDPATETNLKIDVSRMRGCGLLVGLVCIAMQLLSALQYLDLFPSWVNIFPMMADVLVVSLGAMLLKETGCFDKKKQDDGRSTDSKGVDVMIAMMGIIGFLYWFHKTTIIGSWVIKGTAPNHSRYLRWTLFKNIFRSFGIIFQLFFFMNIDPLSVTRRDIKRKRIIHFIIPAMTLALLGVFTSTIVDTYSGIIEELLELSELSSLKRHLLEAGEPIHLGFCLHLFLYLFIMSNNIREKKKVVVRNGLPMNPVLNRLTKRRGTLKWRMSIA